MMTTHSITHKAFGKLEEDRDYYWDYQSTSLDDKINQIIFKEYLKLLPPGQLMEVDLSFTDLYNRLLQRPDLWENYKLEEKPVMITETEINSTIKTTSLVSLINGYRVKISGTSSTYSGAKIEMKRQFLYFLANTKYLRHKNKVYWGKRSAGIETFGGPDRHLGVADKHIVARKFPSEGMQRTFITVDPEMDSEEITSQQNLGAASHVPPHASSDPQVRGEYLAKLFADARFSAPNYGTYLTRLSTFSNWRYSDIVKPNKLAEAGLYIPNPFDVGGDRVRCFCCGIGLKAWRRGDDPLREHLEWSPRCVFARYIAKTNLESYVTISNLFETMASLEKMTMHDKLEAEAARKKDYERLVIHMGNPETLRDELIADDVRTGVLDKNLRYKCLGDKITFGTSTATQTPISDKDTDEVDSAICVEPTGHVDIAVDGPGQSVTRWKDLVPEHQSDSANGGYVPFQSPHILHNSLDSDFDPEELTHVEPEMEEERDVPPDVEKEVNTIVTEPLETVENIIAMLDDIKLQGMASSEIIHRFPTLTNRWFPVRSFSITANPIENGVISHPDVLFETKGVANKLVFDQFLFSKCDVEYKLQVNSNRMTCGRLLMYVVYDAFNVSPVSLERALLMHSAQVDYAAGNSATLVIPYKNISPFVKHRNIDQPNQRQNIATLHITHLATPRFSDTGPQSIPATLYVKMNQALFAGMSYYVDAEMEDEITSKIIDDSMSHMHASFNIRKCETMKFSPGATPKMTGETATKDLIELAQQWGFHSKIQWNTTDPVGTILTTLPGGPSQDRVFGDRMPPVDYWSMFYTYYSGNVMYKFVICSTAFHTGAIQASFIPGSLSGDFNNAKSSYFKTMYAKENREFEFVVPYIHNAVMAYLPNAGPLPGTFPPDDPGRVQVRVMNNMNPTSTVASTIDIIIYKKAGETFRLSALKMPVFGSVRPPTSTIGRLEYPSTNLRGVALLTPQSPLNCLVNEPAKTFEILITHPGYLDSGTERAEVLNSRILLIGITDQYRAHTFSAFTITGFSAGNSPRTMTVSRVEFKLYNGEDVFMRMTVTTEVMGYNRNVRINTGSYIEPFDLPPPPQREQRIRYVEPEMEVEENEVDQSVDFQHAKVGGAFINYDCAETNVLALLRRFTKIGQLILPPGVAWAKPIFPVHRYQVDCVQSAILRSHRWARGSLRMMIAMHDFPEQPYKQLVVEMVHIPVTLACYDVQLDTSTMNLTDTSYYTTHVNLSKTATKVVEIPMTGPYSYIDLQAGEAGTVISTRTKLSANYGMMVFRNNSDVDINLDVYMACSDDFVLHERMQQVIFGTPQVRHIDEEEEVKQVDPEMEEEQELRAPIAQSEPTNLVGDEFDVVADSHKMLMKLTSQYRSCVTASDFSELKDAIEVRKINMDYHLDFVQHAGFTRVREQLDDLGDTVERRLVLQKDFEESSVSTARSSTANDQQQPGSSGVFQRVKNTWNTSSATISGLGNVASTLASEEMNRAVSQLPSMVDDARETLTLYQHLGRQAHRFATKAELMYENIKDMAYSLYNTVASKCSWIKGKAAAVFGAILQFLQVVINPTWECAVLSITGIINSLGLFTMDIIRKIMSVFTSSEPEHQSQGDRNVEPECEHPLCTECGEICSPDCGVCSTQPLFTARSASFLVSTIIASLCAACHIPTISSHGLGAGMLNMTRTFFMTIQGCTNFLKEFFVLLTKIFQRMRTTAIGQVATEMSTNPEEFREFCSQAELLLNEINLESYKFTPRSKLQFWCTVAKAHQIRARLAILPTARFPALLRVVEQVINLGNSNQIHLKACPVRYEPFVLGLEGGSGVGKSFLLSQIMPELLRDAYKFEQMTETVFTRTPGVDYWNGYTNQPVIVYDDFLASMDPNICNTQVIELYNLKSSAIMNMNMARIEEKELRGNPLIVALATNNAFTVPNGVVTPRAFLRRRDALWDVRLKKQYEGKMVSQIDRKITAKFGHLEFEKYERVWDNQSLSANVLNYDQFVTELKQAMSEYHARELDNTQKRIQGLTAVFPESARAMMMEKDPFRIFYSANVHAAENGPINTGAKPSQLLEMQMEEIAALEVEAEMEGDQASPEAGMIARLLSNLRKRLYITTPNRAFVHGHSIPTRPVEGTVIECPICVTEKEASASCVNGHQICSVCYLSIASATLNTSSDVDITGLDPTANYDISCPTCRQYMTLMPLSTNRDTHQFIGRYVAMLAQKKAVKVWETFKEYYLKFGAFVYNHPYQFWSVYSGLIIAGRLLAHSRVARSIQRSRVTLENIENMLNFSEQEDEVKQMVIARTAGTLFPSVVNDTFEMCPLDSRLDFDFWVTDQGVAKSLTHTATEVVQPGGFFGTFQMEKEIPEGHVLIQDDGELSQIENSVSQSDDSVFRSEVLKIESALLLATGNGKEMSSYWTQKNIAYVLKEYNDLPPRHKMQQQIKHVPCGVSGVDCCHWDLLAAKPCQIGLLPSGLDIDMVNIYQTEVACKADCMLTHENGILYNLLLKALTVQNEYKIRDAVRTNDFNGLPQFYQPHVIVHQTTGVYHTAYNQVLTAISNGWQWLVHAVCEHIWNIIKFGAVLIGAIASLIGAYKLFTWCNSGRAVSGELVNSGSEAMIKARRKAPVKKAVKKVTPQMGQEEEVLYTRIKRNTVILSVNYVNAKKAKCNRRIRIIGVFGKMALINAHAARFVLDRIATNNFIGCTIKTVAMTEPITWIPEMDSFVFTSTDSAYVKLPPQMPMFKDITNFVATAEQHRHVPGKVTAVGLDLDCQLFNQESSRIGGKIIVSLNKQSDLDPEHNRQEVYLTDITAPGKCAVLYCTPSAQIFAFHVAGDASRGGKHGYALPMIREDLQALKENELLLSYFIPSTLNVEPEFSLAGAYIELGGVAKREIPYQSVKTNIVPSLIAPLSSYKAVTEPTILSPHDPRYSWSMSPLYWGASKHANPIEPLDTVSLKVATEHLFSKLEYLLEPQRVLSKLTYKEAVLGFELPNYDKINPTTSAGVPWCLGPNKSKEKWLNYKRDANGNILDCEIDKELIKVMDGKTLLRQKGIRPMTIFADVLKDERRKRAKLDLPDCARIISLSPVDFTIQLRQKMLDFTAAYRTAFFNAHHAIGIAVDGPQWSELANMLLTHSEYIVTGDYSDFGPRLSAQVVYAIFQFIDKWYGQHQPDWTQQDSKELAVMAAELYNANHQARDLIYQVHCGSPSGATPTVEINSIVNTVYIYMAYYDIMIKQGKDMTSFDEQVKLVTYGDDMIMSVSVDIIKQFNCTTISKYFAQYGIQFTDASKKGTVAYDKLENSSFLKRTFLKHPTRQGQWLAPLDEVSVKECAMWVNKTQDMESATIQNVEGALRLAYSHGPKYFESLRTRLQQECKKAGLKPPTLTWVELDRLFFGESEASGAYIEASGFVSGINEIRSTTKFELRDDFEYDNEDAAKDRGSGLRKRTTYLRIYDNDEFNAMIKDLNYE